MDAIAMGLMAGWEVNGSVLQGHFASQWQSYDADPEVLIETMLQMPLDRETLLNPKIERFRYRACPANRLAKQSSKAWASPRPWRHPRVALKSQR
jgi:hypothetical protein